MAATSDAHMAIAYLLVDMGVLTTKENSTTFRILELEPHRLMHLNMSLESAYFMHRRQYKIGTITPLDRVRFELYSLFL